MSGLRKLLEQMGTDAALEAELQSDPEGVMERFNLSEEEKQALRERDEARLRELSGIQDYRLSNGSPVKDYD